jgi:pimeloyl-ACP methyl ester carboxylesterase
VVLIHGFGACIGHWRHTIPALARHFHVFALDLLGFGASDKPCSRLAHEVDHPHSVRYCFDLWAEQVEAFVAEKILPDQSAQTIHLIGNSIGGLVALNTARLMSQHGVPPAQVVLIDCTQRGLDEKRVASLPAWKRSTRAVLKNLVGRRWLTKPLFHLLAQPANIRAVLRQAYPSGNNLDDELVALLHEPATDPGAVESFRGFINIFEDHLAPDLLAKMTVPVRMIWGEKDPWEDPEEARCWQRQFGCVKDLVVLDGLGHCPHDEGPCLVNPILIDWLGGDRDCRAAPISSDDDSSSIGDVGPSTSSMH